MHSTLILFVCLTLGLAACQGEPQRQVMVTDSAGVRISISPYLPRVFAYVDSLPVVSLGGPDAAGPTQFYRIQGVQIDPSGRLWVADGGSGELRIFEPDGSHWKTMGGRGEGPGEFMRIRLLGSFRGDSVAVWDAANGRLTVFGPAGEFARTARVPWSGATQPRAFDVFSDGSILAQITRLVSAGSLAPGQLLRDTVRLVRIDLEDATDEPQGEAPGPVWLWTGRNQVPIPFTINASFDLYDQAVHLVTGPVFRLRVFREGHLLEVYGVARQVREVTQDDVTAYREYTEEFVPESQQHDYLSALDDASRPTILPAYSRVVVSSDGAVWAQIYSPDFLAPSTWDVYSPGREWLGEVQTPEGFMMMGVTAGSLVGVWRDDMGVEHVRVYRIRPG